MSLVINLVNLVLLVLTIIVLNTIKDKKVKTILIGITLLFTFVVRLFIRLNLVIWFIFYAVIIIGNVAVRHGTVTVISSVFLEEGGFKVYFFFGA